LIIASVVLIGILFLLKTVQYSSLQKIYKDSVPSIHAAKSIAISIIVAAKNEEKNLPGLVDALVHQSYNPLLFEVIFVDDNSNDKSLPLLNSLIKDIPNFKVIEAVNKKFPAKKGALAIGIAEAKNPYLLFTDGDCIPDKEWVSSFAVGFSQGKEILIGSAPFVYNRSLVNGIVCYENLVNSLQTSFFLAMKNPYSAVGRSIGYTKEAYLKVRGFERTMETISGDDDLFIREAVKNNLHIGVVTSREALVYSKTPDTLSAYFNQKVRHLKTSYHYPLSTSASIFLWHECNYFGQYFFLLAFISPVAYLVSAIKILLDIILYSSFQKRLGYKFSPLQICIHSFIYELLLLYNILNSVFKKAQWK
jgi:cellulose synthase/poly-beta-1,6-N-acetylglucosamine synthase-like glycosyltransferase